VPAPYLLVGHSLGGAYVQRYAQRFPDEVAGLLLLDPAHEDWDLYMPEHLQIAKNLGADVELPS
jgi:pimeloyl-ACP methyl ester carboxylesterase